MQTSRILVIYLASVQYDTHDITNRHKTAYVCQEILHFKSCHTFLFFMNAEMQIVYNEIDIFCKITNKEIYHASSNNLLLSRKCTF